MTHLSHIGRSKIAGRSALILACVGGAFLVGRLSAPAPPPLRETAVVYADREITRRDTVTVHRPVVRTLYERTTDTVLVRVPVPSSFRPHGVIHATPLRIDRRSVTLTYWQPDSVRFVQDRYEIPRPRWGVYVDAGAGHSPVRGLQSDLRLNVRRGRMTGHVGVAAGEFERGLTVGARVLLVGMR